MGAHFKQTNKQKTVEIDSDLGSRTVKKLSKNTLLSAVKMMYLSACFKTDQQLWDFFLSSSQLP